MIVIIRGIVLATLILNSDAYISSNPLIKNVSKCCKLRILTNVIYLPDQIIVLCMGIYYADLNILYHNNTTIHLFT